MDFTQFIAPVSVEAPCGVDPEQDARLFPKFKALESRVDPRAKQSPDWEKLYQECVELLSQTRHLRVMVLAALVAACREPGLSGAEVGLGFLRDSLKFCPPDGAGTERKYPIWDGVYPGLYEGNSAQRVQELNELSTALSDDPPNPSLDDGVFLFFFRRHALFSTATGHGVSWLIYELAERKKNTAEQPSIDEITSARDALPASEREALQKSLTGINEILLDLEKFLADQKAAPNWQRLKRILKGIEFLVGADRVGQAKKVVEEQSAGAQLPLARDEAGVLPGIAPGAIQNRAQAEQTLRWLRYYFERHEPSSPVQLLLKRAQSLMGLGFLECLQELQFEKKDVDSIKVPLACADEKVVKKP